MTFTTCTCCDGSGHMSDERARDIFERDGERPNQYFGCDACDGLGEVEVEEEMA